MYYPRFGTGRQNFIRYLIEPQQAAARALGEELHVSEEQEVEEYLKEVGMVGEREKMESWYWEIGVGDFSMTAKESNKLPTRVVTLCFDIGQRLFTYQKKVRIYNDPVYGEVALLTNQQYESCL